MKVSTRDKSLPQTWKDVSAAALNKLERCQRQRRGIGWNDPQRQRRGIGSNDPQRQRRGVGWNDPQRQRRGIGWNDPERQRRGISWKNVSAKGAEYDSQGQAPNNVRRVAPG